MHLHTIQRGRHPQEIGTCEKGQDISRTTLTCVLSTQFKEFSQDLEANCSSSRDVLGSDLVDVKPETGHLT